MIVTKDFNNGIKVHGIQTGTVAVKKEHYEYSGSGILRIPKILFGKTFVPEMPIWVWCIETSHGNYLIDTGETTDYFEKDHFKKRNEDFVNRKILRINTVEANNIDHQLRKIGLSSAKIDAVIMTHLHIDHTDGMRFFDNSAFFISKTDWEKPFGAALSTFPKWFNGNQITCEGNDFSPLKNHRFSKEIDILATPGHTLGHQSVLLHVGEYHILFAGDMTFSEEQLLTGKFGGINLDLKQSKESITNIKALSKKTNLIYLPSHDPRSGHRLMNLQITRAK
jgi:glyoxylase-like metal-dependent hydrolase (beta-lactamase superfamily II)